MNFRQHSSAPTLTRPAGQFRPGQVLNVGTDNSAAATHLPQASAPSGQVLNVVSGARGDAEGSNLGPASPPAQSAIARAEALYRRHYPDRLFVARLAMFLRGAFVVNFPDLFAMGKPVCRAALTEGDPAESRPIGPSHIPDAWYIDLAVGDLRELARLLPYRLPYICFYRKFRSGLKVYSLTEFLEKVLPPETTAATTRGVVL